MQTSFQWAVNARPCFVCAALPNIVHHGMVYVPPGYGLGAPMYGLDEVRGGSGWGAGTFAAGDGSRQPSKVELDFAEYQVLSALLQFTAADVL